MDQQHRRLDLVGVHERRHLQIDIGRLPDGPPLALEAEGRERAVVRAALRDAGFEQIAVGQQVGGHEAAIAVAAHSDAGADR